MYETNPSYTRNEPVQSLRRQGKVTTGVLVPQNETQVLWFCPPGQSEPVDIHAVKEDALSMLPAYIQQDYTLAIAPFEFGENRCAVIQDAAGRRICLIERKSSLHIVS